MSAFAGCPPNILCCDAFSKVQVFVTPQVVNCFKVESDAALLSSGVLPALATATLLLLPIAKARTLCVYIFIYFILLFVAEHNTRVTVKVGI